MARDTFTCPECGCVCRLAVVDNGLTATKITRSGTKKTTDNKVESSTKNKRTIVEHFISGTGPCADYETETNVDSEEIENGQETEDENED